MRRGDLVTVALQGDAGKPRPALVIRADHFAVLPTVVLLPLTSSLRDLPLTRVMVEAGQDSGLQQRSQIMISRPLSVLRTKVGRVIGHVDATTLLEVTRRLAVLLGVG
jgi:mRNA interferase MazF